MRRLHSRRAVASLVVLIAVAVAVAVVLVVTGGGGHRQPPAEAGFGSVTPSTPGLREVRISLPDPTVRLTPAEDPKGAKRGDNRLSREIESAPANAVIHLSSGTYPTVVDDVVRRGWVTISGESDASKPTIESVHLQGATNVRFVDVKFTKGVRVTHSPIDTQRPSEHVQVLNSEVDCGTTRTVGVGTTGIGVRAGRNVTFSGDYVHNCDRGFSSLPQDPLSTGVSITHCLFENLLGDAIDLGAMHQLTIANNVIQDIARSRGSKYHDDGIQFFGNTSDTLIAYNVLANSFDQLLFIQDAIKGPDGTSVNRDVTVLGNLIEGAGAIAVQDQGGLDVQFVGNTIWAGRDGALLIRRSGYTGIVPNRTLLVDNIVQQYALDHVPGGIVQGYNLLPKTSRRPVAKRDLFGVDPQFVSVRTGDFSLQSGSPAANSAAPPDVLLAMARRAHAGPGALRLLAKFPPRDRGALAAVTANRSAAPFTITGAQLPTRRAAQ